jgi:glucose dehydrogenase
MRAGARLVAPGLALVMLAAHLMHAGWLPLAGVALLLIGLLLRRRPWAARTVQVVLAIATIEWALTTYGLAQLRMGHGQPYLRLVLILGSVTLYTALAAAAFEHPALRQYFVKPPAAET